MNINLITSVTGFPYGTATANRIKMVGKAFLNAGDNYTVFTNSLAYNKFNIQSRGTHEGINFLFLHGHVEKINSKITKTFFYFKGIARLRAIISKFNPANDIIYLYSQGKIFNVFVILIARYYKIKIVQEINEWYHENGLKRKVEGIINSGPVVNWSDGALVISKKIDQTVKAINPSLKTLMIPVLEDKNKYLQPTLPARTAPPYCFWMGQIDSYLDDVLFIIKALAINHLQGLSYNFTICGTHSDTTLQKIMDTAAQVGFPAEKILFLGYVSDQEILKQCLQASFYIIPLWPDVRSESRFPTKVASFMFCGKPLLTCKIGDLGAMLHDNENVLFFKSGDEKDLSEKIKILSEDAKLYKTLSENIFRFAVETFDFASYSLKLHQFFLDILSAK